MKTEVVNLRTQAYDEKICRGTIFGNPYEIGVDGTREQVIARYFKWFHFMLRDPRFLASVLKLRGKKLGCFCVPMACHGEIIKKFLDERFQDAP